MSRVNRTSFYQMVKDAFVSAVDAKDSDLASALEEVVSYTKEGSFVSSASYADFYSVIYLPRADAAESLGVSEAALRVREKSMSDKLYQIFGDDFFQLLSTPEAAKEVRLRLNNTKRHKAADILPGNVVRELRRRGSATGSYTVDELSEELDFLATVSNPAIERALSQLDSDKLAFVYNAVENSKGGVTTRAHIVERIKGGK